MSEIPTPNPADQRFYSPPSWFGRHVAPWLMFLLAGGLVGGFWNASLPHGFIVHGIFAVVELLLFLIALTIARDQQIPCFVVGPQSVTKEESGQATTLLFSEIKGFNEQTYKGSTSTYIKPLDERNPTISLSDSFAGYAEIRHLLAAHVPDLDAVERERQRQARSVITAQLLQDPNLGWNATARKTVLKQASTWALGLNVAAVPLGFWALFSSGPNDLVLVLNLGLASIAAASTWAYRGTLRLLTSADDPRPWVAPAIIWPTGTLVFQVLLKNLSFPTTPLWPAAGGLALAFLLLLLLGNWPSFRDPKAPAVIGLVALAAALSYGLAAAIAYNSAFGGHGTTIYALPLLDKHQWKGKYDHYYLGVPSWSALPHSDVLPVESDFYKKTNPGDTVRVRLHRGRLGADWFEVVGNN